MMEIERQKSLLQYDEKEKQKQIQRLQGAKVIITIIKFILIIIIIIITIIIITTIRLFINKLRTENYNDN